MGIMVGLEIEKMPNGDNAEVKESLYGFPIREPDGRRNPNGRSVDVKIFWERQQEIVNLKSLGYKNTEIAGMLGVTKETVSNAINSTLGLEQREDNRKTRDEEYEELREDVMELTRKSLKVYHEIFDEPEVTGRVSIKMKKETADTVALELSGLRAPTQIDTRSMHMSLSPNEIEAFKQRGIAAAKANGKIVELDKS